MLLIDNSCIWIEFGVGIFFSFWIVVSVFVFFFIVGNVV